MDLVIKNAKLLLDHRIVENAGVAVSNGKIVAIAMDPNLPEARSVVDANGSLLMPGAIDVHAHVYDPDYTYREDFSTGSRAAAAGGVTTFIEMPLVSKTLSSLAEEKIKEGERKSIVDFSIHAGMITEIGELKEVKKLAEMGIKSFKVFTCPPFMATYEMISKLSEEASKINGVVVVHAEDNDVLEKGRREVGDRRDIFAHCDSRPVEAEVKAVKKVVEGARGRIHIAHLSSGSAAAEKGRKRGITAETCIQYLIFSREDMEKLGPYLKMTPPLRSKDEVAKLWSCLDQIDVVATDHAPGTREEKEVGWSDIWRAWGGIPGLETLLPLTFHEGVMKRRISVFKMIRLLSRNPARIFGLKNKGCISLGMDADLVIFDQRKEVRISSDKMHYKVGWTPYEGMEVRGWPCATFVRGVMVYNNGDILDNKGRFVRMGD
jgi:allantoinase